MRIKYTCTNTRIKVVGVLRSVLHTVSRPEWLTINTRSDKQVAKIMNARERECKALSDSRFVLATAIN